MAVVVAYASKHGSTQGIAERIAEQLRQLGKEAVALVSGHRACCSHTMEWEEDSKHIKEVKHPRVIETGDRSPQLPLWALGTDRVVTRVFSCLTTQRAKSRRGSRM